MLESKLYLKQCLPLKEDSRVGNSSKWNTNNYSNYIICIDDFAVPKDSSWGFDSYAEVNLDIELLRNLSNVKIYFPGYSSDLETGEKRGTVFLTNTNIDEIFKTNNFQIYSE